MKKIHQILISDSTEPPFGELKKRMDQVKSLYPDYEYTLYNNQQIQELIANNFDSKVLRAYNDLKAYTFKADLARMCILYTLGGLYFDLGIDIRRRVEFDQPLVMVLGISDPVHTSNMPVIESNFLFVQQPAHPVIKKIIDKIVDNVYRLDHGIHPLDISSPITLGRVISKDDPTITFCTVKIDEQGNKSVYYNNEKFYDFKPDKNNADISALGATGTNRYDLLWRNNDSFNIRLSYVVLTNNPADTEKQTVERTCIASILDNLRDTDQLVVIGDVDHLGYLKDKPNVLLVDKKELAHQAKISALRNQGVDYSTGNVVINLDNDILLPDSFATKLLEYIKNNRNFDTLNVKSYLPNGGRCWDRAIFYPNLSIQENIKHHLKMVGYDYPASNLWYNGPLIIRKKHIADSVRFDENMEYRGGEEIELSKRLLDLGYRIKIDTDNYVFHVDTILKHVRLYGRVDKVVRDVCHGMEVITDDHVSELFQNRFNQLKEQI